MSKFKTSMITNLGQELLLNCIAGNSKTQFTRMVFGSGEYDSDENIVNRTQLKNEKQSIPLSHATINSVNSLTLSSVLSNKELTEGYRITEIGLYAKNSSDSDSTEILYALAVAEAGYADYFPEYNGYAPSTIIQDFYIEVADASSTTILVDENALVTKKYFDTAIAGLADKETTDYIQLSIGGQGVTHSLNVECCYTKIGNQVTLMIPQITNSQLPNSYFFSLSGLPEEILPAGTFSTLLHYDKDYNDILTYSSDKQTLVIERSTGLGNSDYYYGNSENGGLIGGMITYLIGA